MQSYAGYAPNKKPILARLFQNKLSAAMIIFGAIVIVFGLISAIFLSGNTAKTTSDPAKQVALNFISYIQKNNASQAYGLFADVAKSNTPSSAFSSTVTRLSPVFATSSPNLADAATTTSGGTYNIYVFTLLGSDKKTYYFKVSTIKSGNTWLVYNYTSDTAKLTPTL
jgi:hypothetical protein